MPEDKLVKSLMNQEKKSSSNSSKQPVLYGGYPLDVLAQAIAMQESSGGKDMGPRYEPNFQRIYGKKYETEMFPKLFAKMLAEYGPDKVYASYGRHQVMWPVAVELGFRGTPEELADETVNRTYFDKKFMRDWKSTDGNLMETFLRYNGGGNPDYPSEVMRYLPKSNVSPIVQAVEGLSGNGNTIPIGFDGGFINIPANINGKKVSRQEAIRNMDRKQAIRYPRYKTIQEALAASNR